MDFKEKFSKARETAKGLLRDMRRGCKVIKAVASDFYHKNPDAIVAIGAVATGTAFLAGAVKGCDAGLEVGRQEAANTIGMMMGAAEGTKGIIDGLSEDARAKLEAQILTKTEE